MNAKKPEVDDDDELIDELDENLAPSEVSAAQWASILDARSVEVRGLLNRGDAPRAVLVALQDPPVGMDDALRERNLKIALEAMLAVKAVEIGATVAALAPPQIDLLMKLTYRGMAFPEQFNAGQLLAWHEKILEVGGLGSVVRSLTDKRTV